MISKSEIKKIRSLNTKKGRDLHRLIVIEGKRLIEQVLESNYNIDKVWTTEEFNSKNPNLIKKLSKTHTDLISIQDLNKITTTQNSSGIIGVMKPPTGNIQNMDERIIILDNIADPGNLGTILRTANWFGVSNILLSEGCVDPYNPKVVRSAMGAHFSMNIASVRIDQGIKELQKNNFEIIAADLNTDNSIKDLKVTSDQWALLMGSEAHGLSESISSMADYKIKIPQVGEIESLNVSVACGIFLYHISGIK